jgi:hypothetical protein
MLSPCSRSRTDVTLSERTGGTIDQERETRAEWSGWPFHYDFRLAIAGRQIYVEKILQDDDPRDPTVHIVSIHDV